MRNSKGTAAPTASGCIAVDKIGCQILFLNAETGEIKNVLNGFPKTVHELLVRPETSRAYRFSVTAYTETTPIRAIRSS